jgi:hypothetical protein
MATAEPRFHVDGRTLQLPSGAARTFESDVVHVVPLDATRVLVLTANPQVPVNPRSNLLLLDPRDGSVYWDAPHPNGFFETIELAGDRVKLQTDLGWTVELSVPSLRQLNAWQTEKDPRYRVHATRLTFSNGAVIEFGSPIREAIDVGNLVVVLAEKGPPGSLAENVAAVNDRGEMVWRVPRLRGANATGPVPYSEISLSSGYLGLLHPSGLVVHLIR